jgi:septum formation protein
VTVLLASGSPRRRDLLRRLGIAFEVAPSLVEERAPHPGEAASAYAVSLAANKAADVSLRRPGHTVIGADTVVVVDDRILGKPRDHGDAFRMLESLAGKTHCVVTGVSVRCGETVHSGSVAAEVRMRPFSGKEIAEYVDSGEPMDKAGGYALQGIGGRLVETVSGCRETVIGLPLCLVQDLLRTCGLQATHGGSHFCTHGEIE